MRRERHECNTSDMSETQATQARHEYYTNDTSAKRVKNFDFDNDTSKNIFTPLYLLYGKEQGEEQFNSKNYLLKMSRFHAKMRLKNALQKLNILLEKAISKSCKTTLFRKPAEVSQNTPTFISIGLPITK